MDFDTLAKKSVVEKTADALTKKGYEVFVVGKGSHALKKIKKLIPEGVSVMNGSSTTLVQIGYLKLLESRKHKLNDLHAKVTAEPNKEKRRKLRRESVLSDYYLGSVHALIENGEFVIASNTGSQIPHIVFTSPNLIFVVSTKKIVPTLDAAMDRLTKHVVPMENKYMLKTYKVGTNLNKLLIFKGELPLLARKITFILVNENLGY
ncbi:hypothetical protein A2714_01045 [Candidatus Woesebacteria bacterium RIFCSPHIGHO2_01_FULL_38_9]|uniref:LUD domain-containing protein n=2 Tax=Candidatus Woeseibacteriota TaxID=1752722 RepID=A0A1F7XYQ0_9BACT|nr:MAG: hypothetical protein A2714_01045 [Candidatus Woesebacteria bacterium RIFCSPHIGHO2_01_FULL_38_9]OGM59561.1 MAG: hypothetical protein A3A75_05940 [Candidatus Woesebacteria bacterium RIFCSPLOWO2_01_FULL_39_10]